MAAQGKHYARLSSLRSAVYKRPSTGSRFTPFETWLIGYGGGSVEPRPE